MWHPKSLKPEADIDLEVADYLRNLLSSVLPMLQEKALLLIFYPLGLLE